MTSTDTYQLKWHSHSSHLNGSVAGLLRSERFTDVVLCTLDGSQIPAHKFILSSCSVYLSALLEGQRSATRAAGLLYVVLPSEISTRALKILVEYMYKGETTVSNEVLDTVLKAGEVLKIRGLWRQTEEGAAETGTVEKTTNTPTPNTANLNAAQKKPDDMAVIPKIAVKKDDKLMKTFTTMNPQNLNMNAQNMNRPMFIGPPKLVFIKTSEANSGLRQIAPKGQTILVTPDINRTLATPEPVEKQSSSTSTSDKEKSDGKVKEPEGTPPRVLRRNTEKKYGKRSRLEKPTEPEEKGEEGTAEKSKKGPKVLRMLNREGTCPADTEIVVTAEEVEVKREPDWDDSSIEEEERSIAEMFHSEMNIKTEAEEDDDLVYSPLTCELCAEVFTVPAAWVRHIEGHALTTTHHTRKRKLRSASDDTEETMALLRCDLCQKHFPNPAEWVRHIQSTHTEVELALSNNSAPPKRHNRFTEGVQNKTCSHCKKLFPSHASMLIHMRTHTGERPFVCGLCNKGFNVKSNLLRHLRTLHDQLISPEQVEDAGNSTDDGSTPSTSTSAERPSVKAES